MTNCTVKINGIFNTAGNFIDKVYSGGNYGISFITKRLTERDKPASISYEIYIQVDNKEPIKIKELHGWYIPPETQPTEGVGFDDSIDIPDLGLPPGEYPAKITVKVTWAICLKKKWRLDWNWYQCTQEGQTFATCTSTIQVTYIQKKTQPHSCTIRYIKILDQDTHREIDTVRPGQQVILTALSETDQPLPQDGYCLFVPTLEAENISVDLLKRELAYPVAAGNRSALLYTTVKIPDLCLPQGTYPAKITVKATWWWGSQQTPTVTCTSSRDITYIEPQTTQKPTKCTVGYKLPQDFNGVFKPGQTLTIKITSQLDAPAPTDTECQLTATLEVEQRHVQLCTKTVKIERGQRTAETQCTVTIPDLQLPPCPYPENKYPATLKIEARWTQLGITCTTQGSYYYQAPIPPPKICYTEILATSTHNVAPGKEITLYIKSELDKPLLTDGTVTIAATVKAEGREKECQVEPHTVQVQRGTKKILKTVKVKIPDLGLPPGKIYTATLTVRVTWSYRDITCSDTTYLTYRETQTETKTKKTRNTLYILTALAAATALTYLYIHTHRKTRK